MYAVQGWLLGISIHALREEGDNDPGRFLLELGDFYPRPPRGGRPVAVPVRYSSFLNFYPRPPRGGRRDLYRFIADFGMISIHALREEGDQHSGARRSPLKNFYPRPPRGGRLWSSASVCGASVFLSTPSARRATTAGRCCGRCYAISIHALREEGDGMRRTRRHTRRYFYPRPPRGGRQQKQRQNLYFQTNYTTFCTNLEEP